MPTETNPVLSRLSRGDTLESLHRGAWALVTAGGEVIAGAGDPNQVIYARSSTKSLQAIPLIESGAADAFGLNNQELAVTAASHNGQPMHAQAAASILDKCGLGPQHLLCGPQRPAGSGNDAPAAPLTNNCSGKHAGFLATAVHVGDDPAIYLSPHSLTQQAVHQAVTDMTAVAPANLGMAIDGCSAPTFSLPLASLARGIATVTNADQLPLARQAACERIVAAVQHHPEMVGGTKPANFDTQLMAATKGRVFAKGGAEGVQTFGVVGEGVGFAAKVDDGSTRALVRVTLAVLDHFGYLDATEAAALADWADPVLRNRAGLEVGRHDVAPFV